MSILVIAEHDNSELKSSTLNALAAATEIGNNIDLLVAGSECGSVAEEAQQIPCVSKVLLANKTGYANALAENLGNLVDELGENYSHILAAATTSGKNFMPRVAALLDVSQISDISAVTSEDTFERPIYAGNCIATVKSNDSIKVITVRTTGFDACESSGGSADLEELDNDTDLGISSFVKEEIAESDRPELTAADVVISGGSGRQNGATFSLLIGRAVKLGADKAEGLINESAKKELNIEAGKMSLFRTTFQSSLSIEAINVILADTNSGKIFIALINVLSLSWSNCVILFADSNNVKKVDIQIIAIFDQS